MVNLGELPEHEAVARAVHGLQGKLLLVDVKGELFHPVRYVSPENGTIIAAYHVLLVVLPMTRSLPQRRVVHAIGKGQQNAQIQRNWGPLAGSLSRVLLWRDDFVISPEEILLFDVSKPELIETSCTHRGRALTP